MPKLPTLRKDRGRQVTGTSYASSGSGSPTDYTEKGSSRGSVLFDIVPELNNRAQAHRTYTKMIRGDASVRVSLRAGKAPELGADYYIEPCGDSDEDALIAELVGYNLFEGMTITWLKFLEQALFMFEDGFSAFEDIWELREWAPRSQKGANRKRYTMLRKLAVRPASTVPEIKYDDNGGPVALVHNAVRADGSVEEVEIPIDKCCIFTFDQNGGDLMGNSILRSAYPSWYYKNHLYKIDAIQKERHGIGIPEVELQPGYSPDDKRAANELTKNLRTNEFARIVRTSMMKIGFVKLEGQPVNVLHSINHHDDQIMKNIMVQFLNAGVTEGGGNRATSATSMDMFLKSMRYVANSLCDAINMYVIPNLVTYNFKTERFPQLRVRNIGETKDLQIWAAAISNLAKNKLITLDLETEQWIRQIIDGPRKIGPWTDPTIKPGQQQQQQQTKPNNGKQPDAGNIGKSPSSTQ